MKNRFSPKKIGDDGAQPGAAGARPGNSRPSQQWNYITDIILFSSDAPVQQLPSIGEIADFPRGGRMPSVLYQAARQQLGLSHAQVSKAANLTTKTINDVENAFRTPTFQTAENLRAALEALGARFVTNGLLIGVVTRTTRQAKEENSRSPRVRRAMAPDG